MSTIELPVLHEIIQRSPEREFAKLNLLVVQHLDYCTLAFMREIKRMNLSSVSIVAKPHSIDQKVASQLQELGVDVVEPSCSELMTYEPCFQFLQLIQKKCLSCNERYGILDLGGYLVGAFHRSEIVGELCIGAVEDTKSGMWVDQKILEPKIPIITVASSRLKDEVEGVQVGSSVARSIENILLNKLHTSLSSKRVMVIGFGAIGRNVALAIRKYGALVSVYDKNPVAMVIARYHGFQPVDKAKGLSENDIIVCCTGRESVISSSEFVTLRDGAILASASSEAKEFDLEINEKFEKSPLSEIGSVYEVTAGKKVIILANGSPVNFFNNQSLSLEVADLVFSEMFLSLRCLYESKLSPKLYYVERDFPEYEQVVARIRTDLYLGNICSN